MEQTWYQEDNIQKGFELTKDRLLNILDISRRCLKKGNIKGDFVESFEVQFNNGGATFESVEEVLALENSLNHSIQFLEVNLSVEKDEEELRSIAFGYCNIENGLDDDEPIYYKVESKNDEDWVKVTTPLIVSTINRTTRPTYGLEPGSSRISLLCMGLFFSLLFMLPGSKKEPNISDYEANNPKPQFTKDYTSELDSLRKLNITNPIELQFAIAYIFSDNEKIFNDSLYVWNEKRRKWYEQATLEFNANVYSKYRGVIGFLVICIITYLFYFCLKYAKNNYPLYNFIWGEYEEQFQKKNKVINFIVTVIIIEVLVGGLLVNFLSSFLD